MPSRENKSKKQSGTKVAPEKRLESVTFFVDRSLGKEKVPDALRKIGLKTEVHADHFAHDAPDTEWLQKRGEENWVVLAKDRAIKKNPLERQAVFSYGAAAFFLTKADATAESNAQAVVNGLRKISNLVHNQQRPFIARIMLDGKVELWLDHKGKDYLAKKKSKG